MNKQDMFELLLQASDAKVGLAVSVSDVDKFKALFYKTRKDNIDQGVSMFEDLSLQTSIDDPHGEVWIVKRKANGSDQE